MLFLKNGFISFKNMFEIKLKANEVYFGDFSFDLDYYGNFFIRKIFNRIFSKKKNTYKGIQGVGEK